MLTETLFDIAGDEGSNAVAKVLVYMSLVFSGIIYFTIYFESSGIIYVLVF